VSLSLKDLSVKRGKKEVLSGVSLQADTGEIVMILGPNGTGKSTLLHAITGQVPFSGSITWQGKILESLNPKEKARQVAFVPQKEKHSFSFTIADLVGMARLALSPGLFETGEDRSAVSKSLQRVTLKGFEERSLLEVSGGELQLALIARALVQDAPLLLLDEPTASLDLARHSLLAQILKEERAKGRAILAATHDLNWALSLADKLVLLKSGKILWQGPPAESQAGLEECFEVKLEWLNRPEGPRVLPGLSV
jgi:iron complex transport system ATP-binding protein